jgi:hypothetical protein
VLDAAEAALGLRFLPTYRRFVAEYGAGSLNGREVYGAIDQDWEATVPDAVGLTLDERDVSAMPETYILIGSTGDGDWYVIDTGQADGEGESPVLRWMPGVAENEAGPPERVADSFGAFLLDQVEQAVA